MFEPETSSIGNAMRMIGDLTPRAPLPLLLARPPLPARPPWPFWPLGVAVALGDAALLAGAAHAGLGAHAAVTGSPEMLAAALGLLAVTLAGGHAAAALIGVRPGRMRLGAPAAGPALLAATLLVLGQAAPAALLAGGLALVGLAAWRWVMAQLVLGNGRGLRFAPRAVVVGADAGTLRALLRLPGLRLAGVAGDGGDARAARAVVPQPALPWLGPIEAIPGLARRGAVEQVVVALPVAAGERMEDLRAVLEEVPIGVALFMPQEGRLLALADAPISGVAGAVKRAEDLLLGGLALILSSPLMALIALAIRLDSPGPVLFRQARTGRGGRVFQVLKFRTMQHHLADPGAARQARQGDARLTRIGAWLRRLSLDELPQLFNVLRGQMSLVGPRPHVPGTRAGDRPFEQAAERYAARHRVRPGITGLAQVRGLRGPTETEEKLRRRVAADLEYIERWSLWLDLWVLARTIGTVLGMRNAY